MSGPISDCLAGRISPEVAIAQMLLGWAGSSAILQELERQRPDPPCARWIALSELVAARHAALDSLVAEIAAVGSNHVAIGSDTTRTAAFFDRAAAHSPEAGVALFSLGDPTILAAATAEIVVWLEASSLLRPDMDILDLGCGFGRVAAALAPRCRSVLGLDVSAGMIAEARRRHARLVNARFETTPGRNLAALPSAAFDLVLAVDSFPYIIQAGLASGHVSDASRILRPSGALVVLNLSYSRDPAEDCADATSWAKAHGLALEVAGNRPFALWNAAAFVLRKPAPRGM